MSIFEEMESALKTPLGEGSQLNLCDLAATRNLGEELSHGMLPSSMEIEKLSRLILTDSSLPLSEEERKAALKVLKELEEMEQLEEMQQAGGMGGGGRGFGGGGGGGQLGGYGGGGGFSSGGRHGFGGGSYEPGIGSAAAAPLGPGEIAQARDLMEYFEEQGFSPEQAAGILGNMETESSFDTGAYNAGEGAIGLCQWEGGRRGELENFAAQDGRSVTDWRTQADFVMHELKGSEGGAFSDLRQCQTPDQAARVFQSEYERSAGLTNRASNAQEIYSQLKGSTSHGGQQLTPRSIS